MSQQQSAPQTEEASGPPLPKWIFHYIINPLMKAILRSPFHGLISENLMLITFTGRKTGKQYTTPLGYLCDGDIVNTFTESRWWKNLQDGATVSLLLKGRIHQGQAETITDPDAVAQIIYDDVKDRNTNYALRRWRIRAEGEVLTFDDVKEAIKGRVLIRIDLSKA